MAMAKAAVAWPSVSENSFNTVISRELNVADGDRISFAIAAIAAILSPAVIRSEINCRQQINVASLCFPACALLQSAWNPANGITARSSVYCLLRLVTSVSHSIVSGKGQRPTPIVNAKNLSCAVVNVGLKASTFRHSQWLYWVNKTPSVLELRRLQQPIRGRIVNFTLAAKHRQQWYTSLFAT